MEWYTYSLAAHASKHNFNIYFSAFNIIAEHPHLSELVQLVDNWSLNIIFHFQIFDNHPSEWGYYLKFFKCFLIFSSVVAIYDAKDF